jgi:glycerol-3-phosphate dehydrogenase subunit B
VILATGRFLGGGLRADRKRIREPLFDLPVHQAPERASWHRDTFLDPNGHPINRAGIEVDDAFRPLDRTGAVVHPALFAAGSILAHQDWMRQKCGAGLALSTARAAVLACRRLGKKERRF